MKSRRNPTNSKSVTFPTFYVLASVLSAMGKPQLVLLFQHFAKKQLLLSEDFNADSVYCKSLILEQICWSCL